MAQETWPRTTSPSSAAASAVAELSKGRRFDELLRRDRTDATIEVVVRNRGALNHYVVHADGTTELVGSLGPSARYRWARRLSLGAGMTFALAIVAGLLLQPHNSMLWVGGPVFAAFLLLWVAALVNKEHDLREYVRSRTGTDDGWTTLPYKLDGWPARSVRQLEAVEALSDEGEGEAYVRPRADGTAEVVTFRDGRRYRHTVDAGGVILEEQVHPMTRAERLTRRLGKTGVGLFVLFVLVLAVSPQVAVAGIGVSVLTWLAGWLLGRTQRLHGVGEDRWFTIETAVPSD